MVFSGVVRVCAPYNGMDDTEVVGLLDGDRKEQEHWNALVLRAIEMIAANPKGHLTDIDLPRTVVGVEQTGCGGGDCASVCGRGVICGGCGVALPALVAGSSPPAAWCRGWSGISPALC